MPDGISCSKCGAPNDLDNQFCGNCGEALQFNCPNCGVTVKFSHRFCPNCGIAQGLGRRLRDIQLEVDQAKDVLQTMMTQYSSDIQSQITETKEGLENLVSQYSDEVKSQHALLDQAPSGMSESVGGKQQGSLPKSIYRSGLGLIGLGLAVIGLSYTPINLPHLAIIGIIVIALGFLLQVLSNFIEG